MHLLCRDRKRAEIALAAARQLRRGNLTRAVRRDLIAIIDAWVAFEPNWRLWLSEDGL